jgi:hypothetical protein
MPVTFRGAAVRDTPSSAVSPAKCTVTSLTSSAPAWLPGAAAGAGTSELLFITHVLLM